MAITGTLEADFSSFNAAVQIAEVKLQAFEGASNKVAASLTQITDQAPPRLAKMAASVGDVGAGADRALGPVNSLRTVMGSFDGVLSSMGVHIGPAARGLSELGDAAGKSVGELGLLGTAGLVVGAAIGGWKLGRAISDMFGLDAAIGNSIASLAGYSEATQLAGIRTDAMALASTRAGRAVTDYTEALQINLDFAEKWRAAVEAADKKLQLLDAPAQLAFKIAQLDAAMLGVMDAGRLPALDAALKSQDFTLKELAATFGVSEEALQHYVKKQQDAKAATDDLTKAFDVQLKNRQQIDKIQQQIDARAAKGLKDAADASAKWAAGMAELAAAGKGWQGVLDSVDGSVVEAIKGYLAAGVSQETLAKMYGLTALQLKAIAEAYREETEAHKKSNDENKRGEETGTKTTATLAKQVEMVHTLAGAYISLADAQKLHEMGGSATIPDLTPAQVEMMGGRAEIERQVALGRPQNPGTNTAEGYADLARRQAAFEAMVRYLASLSYTDNSSPNLPASVTNPLGSGQLPTITINVSGVLDPRTIGELSRGVGDEIMRAARLGRRF